MWHAIGMVFRNNNTEVFDDETPGKNSYAFMGLQAAIAEGNKRMGQNSDIERINIYEVFDGVRRSSPDGRFQLVYYISR